MTRRLHNIFGFLRRLRLVAKQWRLTFRQTAVFFGDKDLTDNYVRLADDAKKH